MSPALGITSSLAGAASSQRTLDTDKAQRETAEQSRAAQAVEKAAAAAGIGQTEEDAQASERDADGRRPWELPAKPAQPHAAETTATAALSKDPSGARGNLLDLLG
jgi:hypothetical protein